MIPSIYNIPGLFRLSTIVFSVPDTSQPETVDRLGNPIKPIKAIAVTMQLDRSGNQRARPDSEYGGFSRSDNIYEGHVVTPTAQKVQELQAELGVEVEIWQSDKMPPEIVEGITTEGSINGQSGTIRVLPVEQTAILAPYQAGFGDRARLELIRRQEWSSSA